jgi:hypothetical protein
MRTLVGRAKTLLSEMVGAHAETSAGVWLI